MENKLEIAKAIIAKHIKEAPFGIYDCRNIAGDSMSNIYDENGLSIDICDFWGYFEVFGLSKPDFSELSQYYRSLLCEVTQ